MSLKDDITALETELKAAGVSIGAVLGAAGVDRSSWTRWKGGTVKGARYDKMVRVQEAARAAIAEAQQAAAQDAA